MLVLSRKPGETIVINDTTTVTVVAICGNRIKLALDAPGDVAIWRGELSDKKSSHTDETSGPVPDCVI